MGNETGGTVLLLAAAPGGKGRLVDATAVLPGLAAVPAGVLTGTSTATLIELADPVDPHAVLSRVRTAAATAGPLVLILAGQLHLDPRQHRLHLALARTTPSTTRYTALPWHWLVSELARRVPETTTALLDLAADADAWPALRRQGLTLGPGVRVYGCVSPPPPRRRKVPLVPAGTPHLPSAPEYLSCCVALWRSGARPTLPELHEQAAQAAQLARTTHVPGGEDALLLSVDTPTPVTTQPPPSAPGTPTVPPGWAVTAPGTTHAAPAAPAAPAGQTAPAAQAVPATGETPNPLTAPNPATPPDVPTPPAAPDAPTAPKPPDVPDAPAEPAASPDPSELAEPSGAASSAGPDEPTTPAPPTASPDPLPAVLASARAGRHGEAASLAVASEDEALRVYGAGSAQALQWLEVRADLARLAQDPAASCRLWMTAAEARLAAGQGADDAEVEAAVDRAHHQWEQVREIDAALELAKPLSRLRGTVPGRQPGAALLLDQRLARLRGLLPST